MYLLALPLSILYFSIPCLPSLIYSITTSSLSLPPYNPDLLHFWQKPFSSLLSPPFLFLCPKFLKKGEKTEKIIILHSHLSSLMIFRGYSIVSLSKTQPPPVLPASLSFLHFLYCATATIQKSNGPRPQGDKWNGIKYHGEFTRISAILIEVLVGFVDERNWWYQEILLVYRVRNAFITGN